MHRAQPARMACPICGVRLGRVRYQGFPVFRCPRCCGYLLSRQRMEGLKRSWARSARALMEEGAEQQQADATGVLRCPGCRAAMRKRLLPAPASFHLDLCEACGLVWLDGGELALVQLAHRVSPQGREAAELQRRFREMSPERRAEFERNLARLPESLPDAGIDEFGRLDFGWPQDDIWAAALAKLWPGLPLR